MRIGDHGDVMRKENRDHSLIRQVICLSDLMGLKPRNVKMDLVELKKITEGQKRRESLVYHIIETHTGKNFELATDHVHQSIITLRYFFIRAFIFLIILIDAFIAEKLNPMMLVKQGILCF